MVNLQVGVYEHYKGGLYLLVGVARHDETEEPLVVYVRIYPRADPDLPMTARRLDSFVGMVDDGGVQVPRFRYLGLTDDARRGPRQS